MSHPAEHSADAAYRRSLDMHDEDEDFWDEEEPDEDEPAWTNMKFPPKTTQTEWTNTRDINTTGEPK